MIQTPTIAWVKGISHSLLVITDLRYYSTVSDAPPRRSRALSDDSDPSTAIGRSRSGKATTAIRGGKKAVAAPKKTTAKGKKAQALVCPSH